MHCASRRTYHMIPLAVFLGLLTAFPFWSCNATPPQDRKQFQDLADHETNIMVPMRDGVRLATDIAHPKGDGKFPAILVRTPYGKSLRQAPGLVRSGYAFVCQDTRGRYKSEGEFYPFINEGKDGYDTIEWIASQPWSNGDVGMTGGSYPGATQLLAAMENPPHLRCIAPAVPPAEMESGSFFNGGAMRLELAMGWVLAQSWVGKRVLEGKLPDEERRKWGKVGRFGTWRWHLPLQDEGPFGIGGPGYARFWNDLVSNWENPGFWKAISPAAMPEKITVPVLITGGFFDIFAQEDIDLLMALRRKGGSDRCRKHTHFLLGPWIHSLGSETGDRDFVEAHSALKNIQQQWFDCWLKGKKNAVEAWPPLRFFVMNSDVWIDTPAWPPAGAQPEKFFINGRFLGEDPPPADQEASTFTYDPGDPIITRGGCNLLLDHGIRDQAYRLKRKDVVAFFSKPLEKDLTLAGPVKAHLYVTSSAPDTDFTAMLVDEGPDGYQANIADGIIRLRYREGRGEPKCIQPGEVVEISINLWSTAWTIEKGHRIGLHISSSNFPRFDRNLNTADSIAEGETFRTAKNTVFHDAARPSALEIHVLREAGKR